MPILNHWQVKNNAPWNPRPGREELLEIKLSKRLVPLVTQVWEGPWHVNQPQTNLFRNQQPWEDNKRKQASRHLTSPQTPAFYARPGCRKVSMGIKPNKEALDWGTGVTSDPGGPHPAGLFWYHLFWSIKLSWAVLCSSDLSWPHNQLLTWRKHMEWHGDGK